MQRVSIFKRPNEKHHFTKSKQAFNPNVESFEIWTVQTSILSEDDGNVLALQPMKCRENNGETDL